MRISEYDKLETLPETANVLLDSENTGTRTMFASDFAKQSAKFLGTEDVLGQVNIDDLTEKVGPSRDACLFYQDGDSKYKADLFTLPYTCVEAHESDSADSGFQNSIPRRRNILRFKNLGSTFTTEQLNEIATGHFQDMFVGDYWEINNIRWRIVDIDYWYGCGSFVEGRRTWDHHLVIMPDCCFAENESQPDVGTRNITLSGGYMGCEARTVLKTKIQPRILESIPENMILKHWVVCCNSVVDGRPVGIAWVNVDIELPTAASLFGMYGMAPISTYTAMGPGVQTNDSRQFALFNSGPKNLISSAYNEAGNYGYQLKGYWLRDIAGVGTACVGMGDCGLTYSSTIDIESNLFFRPVFGLRAPATS